MEVVQCFFDPAERDFYDAFEKKQELSFNKVCSLEAGSDNDLTSYLQVLESWNRSVQLHVRVNDAVETTSR